MQMLTDPFSDRLSRLKPAVLAQFPELAATLWRALAGGRVNQLWRVGDVVIKCYAPNGASPLFPNDPRAEAAALRQLHPQNLAPEYLAQGEDWLAYRYVEAAAKAASPKSIAASLTALHRLSTQNLPFRKLASGSAGLRAHAQAIAQPCRAALPPLPQTPDLPPVTPCLIHGDAVPGNLIATATGTVLIDWQCPALGDPCEDIAAFLSPAMQWLYTGRDLHMTEAEAFLAAFPKATQQRYRALAPLFHWRMAAHCLWKAEQGAPDYRAAYQREVAALPAG